MPHPLDRIAPLREEDRASLLAQAVPRRLRRGELLLRAGQPCTRLGVVEQGVLREYVDLPSGIERTKSFAVEGGLTGSLPDAIRGGPAVCSIVAELDAVVSLVPADAFFRWLDRNEATQRWATALYRHYYLAKADRELELASMDAWGRYQRFRERFPGLEARISQRVVASYVGVTPEHLSRMRSRNR